MRNPTKFGSLKLDIYNSSYDFFKVCIHFRKNALELDLQPLTARALESTGLACHRHKAELGTDRPEFADGELSDDGTVSTSFPTISHTH